MTHLELFPNMESKIELIYKHVAYSKIFTQTRITTAELQIAENLLFSVQRLGLDDYGLARNSVHDKSWITINSHIMRHIKHYIQLFGIPRNTWVYAYESFLGDAKAYNADHKNYSSEGSAMMQYQLDMVQVTTLLTLENPEFNSYERKEVFANSISSQQHIKIVSIDNYGLWMHYKVISVDIDHSIQAQRIYVEFDSALLMEWTNLEPHGEEIAFLVESVDCSFDAIFVAEQKYYLSNKLVNN
jgi:hypothetical protein